MIDTEALKARVDLVNLVRSYGVDLRERGYEWLGRCVNPAHDDKNPSMWVNPAKRMIFCNACGASYDAIAFVEQMEGCGFKDAVTKLNGGEWEKKPLAKVTKESKKPPARITSKPPKGSRPKSLKHPKFGEPTAQWDLLDADGDLLAIEVRYWNEEDGKKEPRMWTYGAKGGAASAWGIGHWTVPRPLYGLNRLAQRSEPKVCITEGPKKAEAATMLLPGMVAISWTGGANGIYAHDWTPLKGRRVLIWPDNDKPGVQTAEKLARLLTDPLGEVGLPSVEIVYPKDKPPKWDLANALEEGMTTEELLKYGQACKQTFVAESPPAESSESVSAATPDAAPSENESKAVLASVAGNSPMDSAPIASVPTLTVVAASAPEPRDDDDDRETRVPLLTEIGVARYYVQLHQKRHKVCHEWKSGHGPMWITWTGTRWKKQPTRIAAWQDAQRLGSQMTKWKQTREMRASERNKFATKKFIEAFLYHAAYDPRIIMTPDEFDADPFLLGTPAGTVDLRTGKLREPNPDDYITQCTSVPPVEGDHPLFDDVLERASGGDADLLRYLWRWLGYTCSGSVAEESFVFLHGKRQSGKTTLIEAIADILGRTDQGGYAVKIDMDTFLQSKHEHGTDRLAHLAGARYAHCAETEEGRTWREALLSEATGGDTLNGRFLYSERFSFRPTHKLWIHGNHKPHLKNISGGLQRRLHLIEYPGQISNEERDNQFKVKLVQEYPAILHSMIQACVEWIDSGGLGMPEKINAAVSVYVQQEDTLGAFLDAECSTSDPQATTPSSEVYAAYKDFLTKMGEFVPSQKAFSMRLQDRGFKIVPSRIRFVQGLTLLNPRQPTMPYRDD